MKLSNSIKLESLIFFLIFSYYSLSGQVTISEESWVLPTYKVESAEKAPIFFSGDNFQGARRVIYPYALNDVISKEKELKSWKALMLENEFIKLCITPEIGGKLYYATDKTNNYNFIYKNNEIMPSNIGMTGAWVSGGIEWCVLHHHRASTFLPMDYSLAEHEDGSKTIYIGETEPRHRMRWTVGVTVHPGKSYFEAEVSIYNPTPYTNTFLYWANVATHANKNYQTIFPPSVEFATFHAKNDFTRWPISTETFVGQDFTKGVDISWWKNVKQSASFFAHDLKEDFMGGYDHGSNSGTVHIGDHNIVKGAKLWEWGSGPRGQATEGRLTETSGPYVEIMVGAFSDNQPDYTWIKPYEVKKWKQYWYPVKDIEGFKNANLNAAVNLEQRKDNSIFIGYYATQKIEEARIILKNGNQIIFQKDISISPDNTFTELVEIAGKYDFSNLYTEMIDTKTNKTLISYQPVEIKRSDNLPKVVTKPNQPQDISTVEELYLTGRRLEQFYKDPLNYYKEALKRDKDNTPSNIALGKLALKNGDYKKARRYFSKAINRLTKDYTRPPNCEALYLQGLTLKAMGLYSEAIDTLYRATWDYAQYNAAYFELSQISCVQGHFDKALHQIDESLSANTKNARAIGLKASIQRNLKDFKGAKKTLANISKTDPLNFRIAYENFLLSKASGNEEKATIALSSFLQKMRNFDQNYIELAVGYLNEGMFKEAEGILNHYKGNHPIVHYYGAYIQDKYGNHIEAKKLFKHAQSLSIDYCFPFRLETIEVLKKAIAYNENDGKAYYYLGNILYDKQPEEAIDYWKNAIKIEPELAMAYRNIGWGYYRHYKDINKAIPYYEQAIELNKSSAILFTELDRLYELNNTPIKTRLKIFEGNEDILNQRDDAFVRQITVLTLAGKPDKSIAYLKDKKFSYREGNSRVREVIIDAQLALGIKYLTEKNYKKALHHFLLAQVPDEEAGSAKLGNRDIQVNYFIGKTYKALRNNKKAKAYFSLATSAEMIKNISIMDYYKGLSFYELGAETKAKKTFDNLIESGLDILNKNPEETSNFFNIFGEKEDHNIKFSKAHTLIGLGYKGLGELIQAKDYLLKALELSASNLWASEELKSL